jgi:hypothetical protein
MEFPTYLKAESQKNVLYYILPGLIMFWPYAIIIFRYFDFQLNHQLNDYLVFVSIIFFIFALGIGTLIEDIGARLEQNLDNKFCKEEKISKNIFDDIWYRYLNIKILKVKEPILLRYYRTLLLRLKFELHTSVSIVLMLVGNILLRLLYPIKVNCLLTGIYLVFCFAVLYYLYREAYDGVKQLHYYREQLLEDYELHKEYYMDIKGESK